MSKHPSIPRGDHQSYMRYALSLGKLAPRKPTNFRVGAVLVDETTGDILSTGYTMELPGNTHAEQCCLTKYQTALATTAGSPQPSVEQRLVLYTTMEPCNRRASGNVPCTETILLFGSPDGGRVKKVYVGLQEPETFVGANEGRRKLDEGDVRYEHVEGLEKEVLEVATAGHEP